MTEQIGTSSQPNLFTSQGTPDPSSGKPEAMENGALASSLFPESEDTSEGFSEKEDTDDSRPAHLGPAKGETGRGLGTVASTKCKVEVGLSPSWVTMMIFYPIWRFINFVKFSLVPIDTLVSYVIIFPYFATMMAFYSILG